MAIVEMERQRSCGLAKTPWTPPNRVFGPVWRMLHAVKLAPNLARRIAPACLLVALVPLASMGQDPPDIDDAAEARLDAPATLHFPEETAFEVVLEAIRKEAGKDLAIEVDRTALKKAGVAMDAKVKLDVEGVPLKAALTQVVRQVKLIYTVRDSKATVTVDAYKEPDPKALEAQMKAVDTTVFAPGYDEAKFRSIEPGMTEAQVHKLIGKPLRETRSKPQVDWYYGPPTLRVTDDGGMFDTSGFFNAAWGYTIARADPEGKILEILGGYFPDVPKELVGQDLETMKKRFGEPIAIRTIKATRYLVYSGSKASGSFRTRALGIDKDGKVADVIAGYYFD
jgi:SmpA / OmlA family